MAPHTIFLGGNPEDFFGLSTYFGLYLTRGISNTSHVMCSKVMRIPSGVGHFVSVETYICHVSSTKMIIYCSRRMLISAGR